MAPRDAEEAQNHIQLKSGEAGDDDDDDDDSDDGDSGGNVATLPANLVETAAPIATVTAEPIAGDGQKPDAKPDDSEIPDVVKPIVDYLKENPPPEGGDIPGWLEDVFGVISGGG